MSSTSGSDGSYTLTISFKVGTDLNTSLSLVQNYVNAALAQLPAGVNAQGVTVRKVSTNILLVDQPVFRRQHVRRDVSRQLRHHQYAVSAGATAWCRAG